MVRVATRRATDFLQRHQQQHQRQQQAGIKAEFTKEEGLLMSSSLAGELGEAVRRLEGLEASGRLPAAVVDDLLGAVEQVDCATQEASAAEDAVRAVEEVSYEWGRGG